MAFLLSAGGAGGDQLQSRGEAWPLHVIDDSSFGADGVRTADVNGDGSLDVTTGWEGGGITRVYVHPGYAAVREAWPAVTAGLSPSAEDAIFADLDDDGAVDVVSSCQGGTLKLFIHWAPTAATDYLNQADWESVSLPAAEGITQWMYSLPLQVDGLRGIDIISGGKNANGQIGWFEAPADPRSHSDWIWHSMSPAGWIMSLIAADMDGDGDEDVVTSDRYGALRGCRWLENPGPGTAQAEPWENHFIGAVGREAMFMDLADLDEDGLVDAVAAVQDMNAFVWMRRLDATGVNWHEYVISYPPNMGAPKAAAVADINRDGRPDVVLSGVNATPPVSGVVWMSYLASPFDAEWEAHEISGEAGVKFDRVEIFDVDGDEDPDVMTTEEVTGLGVVWYENPGSRPAFPLWVLY